MTPLSGNELADSCHASEIGDDIWGADLRRSSLTGISSLVRGVARSWMFRPRMCSWMTIAWMVDQEITFGCTADLQEIYGAEVSAELISKVTDAIVPELRAWQQRPLDAVYPILYLDAIVVKVRTDHVVVNRPVYIAMAVDVDGRKHVLGLWLGKGDEGAKFWLGVITELKNRGVTDVLVVCCDGPDRLRRRHRGGVAQHHGPDLCGASDQKLDPFLLVERPQSRHQSAQTHLPGGHHRSRRPGPRRLRNRMGRTISGDR